MEHSQIVTPNELEEFAKRVDSEAAIPELVWRLVTTSVKDLSLCRIPYGNSIGLPDLDGLVETESGLRQFVPKGRSYWEIGRSSKPQAKATADFKKRTAETSAKERASTTFVFVTPQNRPWPPQSQLRWIARRKKEGWKDIKIIDGIQLCDWLQEFPVHGKWLLKKIGLGTNVSGFETVAEHWGLIPQSTNPGDPPLPAKTFLIGRDKACVELARLFRGEITQLLLSVESEHDAEDFVAAFVESLDETTRRLFSDRCLLISDADTWEALINLRDDHVLVANPRIDLVLNERLHMAARQRGHRMIIPVSGSWADGKESLISIRNPSKSALESVFRDAGFSPERARELAGAGAQSLAALKRFLRGLSEIPQYATWENARVLAQAGMLGKWLGKNQADKSIVEDLVGKPYGEWIEIARGETLRPDTPLIQRNEAWKLISRGEAWAALGPRLTDGDLDRFRKISVLVLKEADPRFDIPVDDRSAASLYGKVRTYSESIREGLTETLALLGCRPTALSSCSLGKAESIAALVVRELLEDADWKRWASLSSELPLLAEASPDEFLEAVEVALTKPAEKHFLGVFQQEGSGIGGWNYTSGLLWALETLAWHPDYLVRVTRLLGELAAMDPGGSWSNRPKNSLSDVFLPWHPQTTASISQRKAAVEALLRDQPSVGWQLLQDLLPSHRSATSGTRKPVWRDLIPGGWKEGISPKDYWDQVSNYASLATQVAATDFLKLADLVDRLADLPDPAHTRVLDHLCSEQVVSTPEKTRLPIWEALVDLSSKHRKYATSEWAMPVDRVTKIEEVARKLAPASTSLLVKRLFSERDFDLYEESGDFDEQQRKLQTRRQNAVGEILASGGLPAVLDFAKEVESPGKVGVALGSKSSDEIDQLLLPAYLGNSDKSIGAFVESFIRARYWEQKVAWLDKQLGRDMSPEQRLALFVSLPFDPEVWHRAEDVLGDTSNRYWAEVVANPWGLDTPLLIEAAERLIQHERFEPAIDSLYILSHRKVPFSIEIAEKALMGILDPERKLRGLDQNHIVEVINWLQETEPKDSAILFKLEWSFLSLLNKHSGGEPKTIERKLSSDPALFRDVIAAVFRSDKEDKDKRTITETDKQIAQNAYRLLNGWAVMPGVMPDGTFDADRFSAWWEEAKRLTMESGHLQIAMDQLGQALHNSPADPNGLWIHHSVAEALDAKDAEKMRRGFSVGLFNKRGVHGFSAGEEELTFAKGYREKADALASQGFHRVADTVRNLAKQYERDAHRQAGQDMFGEPR